MTVDELRQVDQQPTLDLMVLLTTSTFDIRNQENRTLLYGYDCDRFTWHLYSLRGGVWLHVYRPEGNSIRTIRRTDLTRADVRRSMLQSLLIPNKRLYPERCDYAFCMWAKGMGLHLPFTDYDAKRAVKDRDNSDYFGKI